MKEILTQSASGTKKEGVRLVGLLMNKKPEKNARIIALEGHLGSGKTTFIQGLAEGLGVKENVLSPTFLILKQFFLKSGKYKSLYHIDAYRLKNYDEIVELGFDDLVRDPENIIVIEWADKIRKILPKNAIWIKFENMGGSKRRIVLRITNTAELRIRNSKKFVIGRKNKL